MRLILLIAGSGTRLRPYTNDRPKCLVEVAGVSLLERQLKVIKSLDLKEIVAVTGYKECVLNHYQFTKKISNPRYSETNMLYSLLCAKEYFTTDIIVSYGDIVYTPNVLENLMKTEGDIVVAADSNWRVYWEQRMENPISDLESFSINEHGNIVDIGNPVSSYAGIDGQYIGLMKISQRCLNFFNRLIIDHGVKTAIFSGRTCEEAYMTDFIRTAIDHEFIVKPVLFEDYWVEIDTVEDLKSTETHKRLIEIDDRLSDRGL